MQWFPGTVSTAIQISRKNKALLIVYIETDDDKGQQFNNLWNDVDSQNVSCSIVGIKLKKGEASATQFAEIYPTPILPAAYLIDQNGKPLEVITHLIDLNNDSFRSRFNRAVSEFQKANPDSTPVPVAASVAPSALTPTSPSPNPLPAPPTPERSSSLTTPANVPTTEEKTAEKAALEEKVRRAKELLEQKKKLNEEKKLEEEKAARIERINSAKAAQAMKLDQNDKALIEAAKQRARDKLDTEKERERVKAQIKADRQDAELRRNNRNGVNNEKKEQKVEENDSLKAIPSDRCRVQVRLPDGTNLIEEFPSSDHLQVLVDLIRQKSNLGDFQLSQSYPRRVFNAEHFEKSFLDNSLTPSAVLFVSKKSNTSLYKSETSSIYSYLWFLKSPFSFLYNLVSSIFNWNDDSGSASKKDDGPNQASTSGTRPRGMPRSAEVRRRGNVAGLHNPNEDDPEEKASFNGNSTQFM